MIPPFVSFLLFWYLGVGLSGGMLMHWWVVSAGAPHWLGLAVMLGWAFAIHGMGFRLVDWYYRKDAGGEQS